MPSSVPASQPSAARVFVPVRRSPCALVLRTYVDPLGQRTGVAFTDPDLLREVLGEDVAFVELGVRAYRALLAASGTGEVCIDPRMSAARPTLPDRSAEVVAAPAPAALPPVGKPGGPGTFALHLEGFAA